MNEWEGKGSNSRVSNQKRFNENFDRIFGNPNSEKPKTEKRDRQNNGKGQSNWTPTVYPL